MIFKEVRKKRKGLPRPCNRCNDRYIRLSPNNMLCLICLSRARYESNLKRLGKKEIKLSDCRSLPTKLKSLSLTERTNLISIRK